MEESVVEKVQGVLDSMQQNDSLLELEKSSREFQKLVDSGLAQRRGYNLQSCSDNVSVVRFSI